MGSMNRRARRRKQYREEHESHRHEAETRRTVQEVLPSFAEFATWPESYEVEAAAALTLTPALLDDAPGALMAMIRAVADRSEPGVAAFLALTVSLGRRHPSAVRAASSALDRLRGSGAELPPWTDTVTAPLQVTGCRMIGSLGLPVRVAVADWERAGSAETATFLISPTGVQVAMGPQGSDEEFLQNLGAVAKQYGIDVMTEPISPGQLRALIEGPLREALDDSLLDLDEIDSETEEEELADFLWTVVAYCRIAELPVPTAREVDEADIALESAGMFELADPSMLAAWEPPEPPVIERDGPAPVYRLRIDLKGAKPPIWRRLEIGADATLGELHRCIQVLFDWDGSHMHRFDTDYGDYADRAQNFDYDQYRDAHAVTLEQVLGEAGDRMLYEYDFGDGHMHVIKLEAVEAAEAAAGTYPRCTAGRRQAPVEDTGGFGLWGEQVRALEHADHPHHGDAMAWVGLEPDDPESAEHRDDLLRRLTAEFEPAEATRHLRD